MRELNVGIDKQLKLMLLVNDIGDGPQKLATLFGPQSDFKTGLKMRSNNLLAIVGSCKHICFHP
jgi:hypothetical protein